MNNSNKQEKALKNIKSIIDNFFDGNYTITVGKRDFDVKNHIYDVTVIMGMISNHVYEGLGLDIPDRMKKGDE